LARATLAPSLLKAVTMRLVPLLALAGLAGLSTPAGAESLPATVLQNDSFSGGTSAGVVTSFEAGNIIASRFTAPGSGSALIEVLVAFGGGGPGPLQVPVTVKVWDDTAQTDAPGMELYSGPAMLMNPATPELQLISLAGVGVPDRFRVGIVLGAAPPPMIGHDTDGISSTANNLVFRTGTGWTRSQSNGVPGDWILRARVSGGGGGGGGGTGACFGVDCPAGQFCDDATRQCTSECRTEADCGGATCNNNGQCVGEGGVGCCQTGGGAGRAAGILALGVLVLLLRRRRR
jgi:MYXO-CTERM domain-containing protein